MARSLHSVQYERHAIHLMSRILSVRPNVSPFTLVLDDLNQRAGPLVEEIVRRALARNIIVIAISFERTQWPEGVQIISGFDLSLKGNDILRELDAKLKAAKDSLVIVDSLPDLILDKDINISDLFGLIAGKHQSTLIGVYHTDILPSTCSNPSSAYDEMPSAYQPSLLETLKFTATSILTCRSFAHVREAHTAQQRSLPAYSHGLLHETDGVVESLTANDRQGIVLDAEFRRKSGRPEHISYFLRRTRLSDFQPSVDAAAVGKKTGPLKTEYVMLLDQHPAFRLSASKDNIGAERVEENSHQSTFNLALTEKQKMVREGVVLPYFDAQKGEGGEGGRILYDMGEEDDFDEEEDEI